jgi:hypothetical protein
MRDIVEDRLLFQSDLREVKRMRQWVLDAEHILSADSAQAGSEVSNARVGQQFDIWRQELRQQMMQDCLSQEHQQCASAVFAGAFQSALTSHSVL